MKNFFKMLMLLSCLVLLVNCSKSSDKKSNSNNNQCYNQAQTGQTYYNQNCQNSGNGGGYNGGNPGGNTQQCHGWYRFNGQNVYCDQYSGNCRGYTLQDLQTGQSVNCQ